MPGLSAQGTLPPDPNPVPRPKLRVWSVSGELAEIPLEGLSDVKSLKRQLQLQGFCGVPRFQQRLLRDGVLLDDAEPLGLQAELQLVIVPYRDTTFAAREMFGEAIKSTWLSAVETLLRRPHDPNLRCEDKTYMQWACLNGNMDVINLLLEAGADIQGALPFAAAKGHRQVVQLLLDQGAPSVDIYQAIRKVSCSRCCDKHLVQQLHQKLYELSK